MEVSADANSAPFATRTVLVMVVLGTIGFLAFLLLSAYGEDLQPAQRPGNHALATSAVGFAGAADLVRAVHGSTKMVRRDGDLVPSAMFVGQPSKADLRQSYEENVDPVSRARLDARKRANKLRSQLR